MKKIKGVAYVLAITLLIIHNAYAQDRNDGIYTMLAKNYRQNIPEIETPFGAYVLTAKDIDDMKARDIFEIFRALPSVTVENYEIFLRGVNIQKSSIMIDGFSANLLDLNTINVELIESVEVANSKIYITTKNGSGEANCTLSGDTSLKFDDYKISVGVNGGSNKYSYILNYFRFENNGLSHASENYYGNYEKDGSKSNVYTIKIKLTPHKNISEELNIAYYNSDMEQDNGGGAFMDDSNKTQKDKSFVIKNTTTYMASKYYLSSIKVLLSNIKNEFRNDPDTLGGEFYYADYREKKYLFDLQNDFYISRYFTFTLDGSYGKEEANGKNLETFNAGSSLTFDLKKVWVTTASGNFYKYNGNDEKYTYKVETSFLIAKVFELKGSYGTNYKMPTLYDLYKNEKLKAEESEGYEFGFSTEISKQKFILGAKYFDREYTNLIAYDENIDKAKVNGVEAGLKFKPADMLSFNGTYTYLASDSRQTHTPQHSFYLSALLKVGGFKLEAGANYVDSRFDGTEKNKAYTLLNMSASYNFTKSFQMYMKATNLLDQKYEEVLGYGTRRMELYIGATLKG